MSVHQHAGEVHLSNGELRAEMESASERLAAIEVDLGASQIRLMGNLARHMLDGVSVVSPEGVHLDVNPALCTMVGLTREELIGSGLPHLYWPPEKLEWIENNLRERIRGVTDTVETTFMRKNGERFPVLITPSRIRDEAGELICIFATIKDVSEQRRAEDALRESEARYRSLFEDSPIAMWEEDDSAVKARLEELAASGVEDVIGFLLSDPQEYARCLALTRDIAANKAAVRLFEAKSSEELVARNSDLYRQQSDCGIHHLWAAMLAGERTATFEEANVTPGGKELRILETCTVVPGHEETFDRVYIADVDISEQERAKESLRESEERYRTVVENAPVGIFQSTPEGEFALLNPACVEAFGCETPAEMIELIDRVGTEQALYEDPDDRGHLLQSVHDAAGSWVAFKTRLHQEDGTVHVAVIHACERPDPATGQANLFGFVQDVTVQEQAEKALEHSAELLGHGERLAHVGSWEWDVVAGMCSVSAEWQRMHGLTGDVVSDDEANATCHEDDRPALRTGLARAAAGHPYRVAHRIVHPVTRELRHLMTYGDPVRDAEGRLERVLGASLDVTERVRADETLREREKRLQRALDATVAALGATVAMRDPYTADHERRVALLAGLITERLGWSAEATERIQTAALVHDVGKIAVPAEILSKPTRLTETEFALIKAHSAAAYEILAPIEFDGPVAEIVYQHHERLDGSGYPRGLSGDAILPGARVLAIADVVEAMITHRPYRAALPLEEALAEIGPNSRGRFDAEAAEVCRSLFEDEGFSLLE